MQENNITYFAETDARNKRVRFGIKDEDRLRHIYSIGKTGMGKSTMLENMAIQDIQNGNGMAFLDPHGKTADLLLDYIPEERIKDVIYFAPFDTEHPISFNVMEDVGENRRHLVLSGLMSAFEKLFGEESFSDRMQYILQNTILALLEYPGATMLGINKMLSDKTYRNSVIANITDPSVKDYWIKEYAGYTERFAAEAIPAIQNKIGQFTSNPLIRNIIGQPKSSFDIRKIMDDKKILIVNLSKGLVGENNANLLGSMLVTKIYLAAMSRADADPKELKKLPSFYLYVDEFQSFANKSFANILSEARKYKLSLNITHQYVEQMAEEVRAAVFGNVGTMIAFRVGSYDAEILEKEFAPIFTMEDLVNLGFVQIYLKLMIDGVASQPFSATTLPPIPKVGISFRDKVVEMSRKTYTKPKAEIEKTIKEWHSTDQSSEISKKSIKKEEKIEEKPKKNNALGNAIKEAVKEKNGSVINNQESRREKISLKELKPKDKSKKPSPGNLNALKEALNKIQNSKTKSQNIEEKEEKIKEKPKPNEVPEETLKKILKGE
ncbi:MAG: type IV secretion system DNA-binding domain-containing protein [Candidatus Zambryskibacteria bacterium]|nr:type IV secretion system DNA-binding domain-containing protein [Candidatus Zambryskibacteria bacterium]